MFLVDHPFDRLIGWVVEEVSREVVEEEHCRVVEEVVALASQPTRRGAAAAGALMQTDA